MAGSPENGNGKRVSQHRASRGANLAFAGDEAEKKGMLICKNITERGDSDPRLMSKLLAEATGTFFLVFTVGVSVHSKTSLAPAAIGLVLSIMIYNFASVSGGMFNPAVTLAVLLSRREKIRPEVAGMYIGAQCIGGIIAGLCAFVVTDKSFCFDWEENANGGWGTSVVLEAVYTAALCSTVLASGTSLDAPNQYYGFAIGLTVMASAWSCSSYDQGSFNPAVTLGINMGNLVNANGSRTPSVGSVLLFILTPLLGSCIAAGIYRLTRGEEYQGSFVQLREKLLCEFVGTFYLVFTVGVAATGTAGDHATVAIGMMLGIQIYTFGSISGGLFNPAVALTVLLSGRDKISPVSFVQYIGVQFLGAICAGFAAFGATHTTFCFDHDGTVGGAGSSFLLEMLFTTALCITVLATGTSLDAPNQYFGFAIGLTVTVGASACGMFDQGSFNPAVTVGINMANYANSKSARNPSAGAWFLFLLTPFCGSILAAGIFRGTRVNEYRIAGNIQVGNPTDSLTSGRSVGKASDTE